MAKKKSITLEPGYVTATSSFETDAGKESSMRLVSPEDSTVTVDGDAVKITEAVANFVMQVTAEKAAKESKEESAEIIRTYAGVVRKKNAKKGDYYKSLRINGKLVKRMQYAVAAISSDKFSTPTKKEDIEALKTALGKDVFDSLFETSSSIAIRADIMKDDAKRKELSRKLVELFGVDGIKEYFERKTILKTKKGLDEKQYRLDDEVLQKLEKAGVKQSADSLKDVSETVA